MQTKVIIQNPGLMTTVQDQGRPHFQHLGIPACGAMDPLAWQLANLLVGNQNNEACLECTLSGPVLTFTGPTLVAFTGATVEAKLNGYAVPMSSPLLIQAGDVLDLTKITLGLRLYVAFAGGIDVPEVLGSRSTYLPLQFGLYDRKLKAGDELLISHQDNFRVFDRGLVKDQPLLSLYSQLDKVPTIHLVPGPQQHYFSQAMCTRLTEEEYTLDVKSDRMGLRFNGPQITAENNRPMISDGIPWGAMQITRGGQPIVMMSDRQPTGGYPKIAKVIHADLPLLAQLRPQAKVKFAWVTIEEALQKYQEQQQQLLTLKQQLLMAAAPERTYRIYGEGELFQVSVTSLDDSQA